MSATDIRLTPRHITLVACAALALLAAAVLVPERSGAQQIGDQTGYQEWAPDGDGGEGSSAGSGGSGGSTGDPAATGVPSGTAVDSGSTAPSSSGEQSGGGSGGGGGDGGGDRSGGNRDENRSNGGGSGNSEQAGGSEQVTARPSDASTGSIPLTGDNLLLAAAVAAVAVGAGFGVNRLARRTAGT
jgi:hypothetical protein